MTLLESLLYDHILPSALNAVFVFLIVLLVLKIFRVKDPSTRFMFLFLPLIKPFLALLDKASADVKFTPGGKPIIMGFKMADPFNLITRPLFECKYHTLIYSQSTLGKVIMAALFIVCCLLVLRWLQLFLFLNSFRKDKALSRSEYPQIYEILDSIVNKFRINQPKLILAETAMPTPFVVGHRLPIIVLTKDLIKSFSDEQLEVMLAHELAHISRKDNLLGWLSIMLRDILFFNPISRITHRMLEQEKEKACDQQVVEKAGISPAVVSTTLLDIAIFRKKALSHQKHYYNSPSKSSLFKETNLEKRIAWLSEPNKKKPTRLGFGIKTAIFIVLLYIQPFIFIKF